MELLATDLAMLAALVVFAIALFWRGAPQRRVILPAAAVVAVVSGAISLWLGMWQAVPGLCVAAVVAVGLMIATMLGRKDGGRARPILSNVAAGFLLLLTVGAVVPYFLYPIPLLPKPTGEHKVGTLVFDMIDPSRKGVLDDATDIARRIYVQAWYPAGDVNGLSIRPYFTDWEIANTARSVALNWGFPEFGFSHLRHVRTHGYDNAPVAEGRFPLVIFSHGYWSWGGQSTALMEEMASRGYVVLSLVHPYDTGDLKFSDGAIIRSSPLISTYGMEPGMVPFWSAQDHDTRWAAFPEFKAEFNRHRVTRSFEAWLGDARFLLASIRSGAVPGNARALLQASDLSKLAITGMSFGGTMAASICDADPACVAAVNLDGEEFDWSLYDRDIRMPLLMLHSDWVRYPPADFPNQSAEFNQNDYAYERHVNGGKLPNVHRFRIKDIMHVGISDLILGMREPARGGYFGAIDRHEAIAIVNDFTVDFLDRHVKGAMNAFPDAQLKAHPEVVKHDASSTRIWREKQTAAP